MNKILDLIKREPALVLGIVCGAAIWALTRFLGYTPSAAEQAVYGFVPVIFAAVTRQFVTPATSAASGTQSALDTFMAALHHPAIFGSIVSRLRNELPTILAEATQATVTVTPGPAKTDGAAGATALLVPTAPVEPLPPLIPPDVPQEAPAAVQAVAETPGPVPAV